MSVNNKLEVQNYESMEDLYSSIDENGSIGLLALGATGLLLWRKKKQELKKQKEESENGK